MKFTNLRLDPMLGLGLESSQLKAYAIELLLVVCASAFWLVALPFAATSLGAVKIWDTLLFRPGPLFLRPHLRMSPGIIHVKMGVLNPGWRRLRSKSHCWSWP